MIIKRFLGKASNHNDHYMINMDDQRPKIGSNWPLMGPYLQCWLCHNLEMWTLLIILVIIKVYAQINVFVSLL